MIMKLIRGDSATLSVVVADADGAVDLTGASLTFAAKSRYTDPEPMIEKSTSNGGIVVTDAAAGKAQILIAPEDTKDLPSQPTMLVYDIELAVGSSRYTVAGGLMEVLPDVAV